MNNKKRKLINISIYCIVFLSFMALQNITGAWLESRYDIPSVLVITAVYFILSFPINCIIDDKNRKKYRRKPKKRIK